MNSLWTHSDHSIYFFKISEPKTLTYFYSRMPFYFLLEINENVGILPLKEIYQIKNYWFDMISIINISSKCKIWGWKIFEYMLIIWASLVAQLVKNLPAMWETWVQFLGSEDPLEKGTSTHSSILAWRIPWICIVHAVTESQTWLTDFNFQFSSFNLKEAVNEISSKKWIVYNLK